ncbi:MAG: glutamate--tRNA ligase, partial [Caldisericaceae bacterium]
DTLKDIENLSSQIFTPYELKEEIFNELKDPQIKLLLTTFKEKLEALTTFNKDTILDTIKQIGKDLKIKGKALYFPLRLAITMSEQGIEVHEFVYFIGQEEAISRLNKVLEALNA